MGLYRVLGGMHPSSSLSMITAVKLGNETFDVDEIFEFDDDKAKKWPYYTAEKLEYPIAPAIAANDPHELVAVCEAVLSYLGHPTLEALSAQRWKRTSKSCPGGHSFVEPVLDELVKAAAALPQPLPLDVQPADVGNLRDLVDAQQLVKRLRVWAIEEAQKLPPKGGGQQPKALGLQQKKHRPCFERDRQFLKWSREGLTPAKIRDRWNREHPDEHIGDGAPGREIVKKGIAAALRDEKLPGEK